MLSDQSDKQPVFLVGEGSVLQKYLGKTLFLIENPSAGGCDEVFATNKVHLQRQHAEEEIAIRPVITSSMVSVHRLASGMFVLAVESAARDRMLRIRHCRTKGEQQGI